MSLEPMVDMIGTYAVKHGERGDLDSANQYACLCGEPDYLLCPNFDDGIQGAVLSLEDGELRIRAGERVGVVPEKEGL